MRRRDRRLRAAGAASSWLKSSPFCAAHDVAALVRERLVAARDVDDAEPPHADRDPVGAVVAASSGPRCAITSVIDSSTPSPTELPRRARGPARPRRFRTSEVTVPARRLGATPERPGRRRTEDQPIRQPSRAGAAQREDETRTAAARACRWPTRRRRLRAKRRCVTSSRSRRPGRRARGRGRSASRRTGRCSRRARGGATTAERSVRPRGRTRRGV